MVSPEFLHFVEFELQAIALTWMATLYAIKFYQLSRLPMPWEQAPGKGKGAAGIARSYGTVLMPWAMESSRAHPWRWTEFLLYHVGALVAIVNTFTFPFLPQIMTPGVRWAFSILIAPALLLGFTKLYRRIASAEYCLISTPDDYFSLISLQLFFFSAIMALLTNAPFWRLAYFFITAAFLFYVPFSKISHYIYFFFSHFLTGRRYGTRGVLPQGRTE